MYERHQKRWYKHLDFILMDLLCILASFMLAYFIRFREVAGDISKLMDVVPSRDAYARSIIYIALIHLILVVTTEPYSRILYRSAADELKKVLIYNVYILMGIILIFFMEQSSVLYSRLVIFTFAGIDIVLMYGARTLCKNILRKKINKEANQSCLILVAPREQLDEVIDKFEESTIRTLRIVGISIIGTEKGETLPGEYRGIPVIGGVKDIYEFARTNVVDEALLCINGKKAREISEILVSMGITTHINIQNMLHIPDARMNTINSIPVLTSSVHFVSPRQMLVKRLIDIFFGIIGSLITLVVTIFVAPMIWISDPGPIFFRQERVGKNGRTFRIWKFRTMYTDAEARKQELMDKNEMNGLMFKMEDDPRIIGYGKKISVGSILRKLSIDELPQFFNILEGSMSVVGTRPPTVNEYEQYELHHKGRLAIKPGLTGMWQVSGRNKVTDFEEVVKLDKYYIDNFCLRLDLEIIFKTVKVVLFRDGSM